MKNLSICLCLMVAGMVYQTWGLPQETYYDSKYDNFDVDSVLNNERVLKNYFNCLVDKGPCTRQAKDFKGVMPEVINTSCQKCSPKQKVNIRKMIKIIREKHPEEYKQLLEKYDKGAKKRVELEKFLNEK